MNQTYDEFIQNILNTRGRFNCGDIYHERHHITPRCMDGDNSLENLELLCPNCHALTENWRGKNIGNKKETVTEIEFVNALYNNKSIRQALISLGLTGAGGNYARAYEIVNKYQIQHLMK